MKLVGDGVVLMVLGQAVVFVFLGLMVGVVRAIAWLMQRVAAPPEPATASAPPPDEENEAVIAAAVAAVRRFRARS